MNYILKKMLVRDKIKWKKFVHVSSDMRDVMIKKKLTEKYNLHCDKFSNFSLNLWTCQAVSKRIVLF